MIDSTQVQTETVDANTDFLTLLEESLAIALPQRGDIVVGTILSIDSMGMLVDLGMKRDGVVTRHDLEKIGDDQEYNVGDTIPVMIIRTEDAEGNMIVSAAQAKQNEDWLRAEEVMNDDQLWEGQVADANRGGLIVPFGNLRGFVPASHVVDLPRGLGEEERQACLEGKVGQDIAVKVIEVNRRRRRLVLSQREAQREMRDAKKNALLDSLEEGEVRQGVVSGLRDFGAFVDLGGADGLIHISELAWHRVKHPRELLNVGDEIDVFVLRLDQEGRRIGLSLKRLQPNPWTQVDELYHVGQLVDGVISRVTQFGAFVSLEPGIEALLHASQISDPAPEDPTLLLREGQAITARVISIEPHRQRLGLSIRDVDNDLMIEHDLVEMDRLADVIEAEDELEPVAADDATDNLAESEIENEHETMAGVPDEEIEAGAIPVDSVESETVEPVAEDEPIAD